MTRIVGNYDLGSIDGALPVAPSSYIAHQPARGTSHVEVVHCVRSNAWKLRASKLGSGTPFGSGDDFADSASPQAASTESKRLVEAIVQLRPCARTRKFGDDLRVETRVLGGEKCSNVFCCVGVQCT